MSKLSIKVKGFDHVTVDQAAKKIFLAAKEEGAKVSGPVPLPTKRDEITILRSVHVNKKSREQFESRTHQRLVVITDASAKTKDKIERLELPVGVGIQVKVK
ncbi:30S ribosomal protein S10 [Mycoplasmopsis canis UFG4]|uniref:Small ribosomal subunit protein uS10 n=1 Tax=Mycoplasmopsis canis UFG4 TaxID=1131455 RepID=I1A4N5_9BACT|nr:30S ribosomal protein S10 [Mycoplasmopsis canis]AKF41347.1 30S ribosomal protein S10 [Mycoplasmopsis canis]EIE39365.1 30S ribosomal protein S10 [Mycoplasmopsis canis UF33]EIE39670.1 30S ribosomal protein S10 [Mycoplasmopsis canis UF31]EIE41306.1 30S ribosomal protein S10 [Mycoplasmopsis canis UFG1]EIE41456.1 30S ribosomal protein S10 [Mycoplasmopsis canis UFG4]